MRQVDGGVFLNEPNIWLIAETMRKLLNESIAKECGVELTKVTVVRKDTGEVVQSGRRKSPDAKIKTANSSSTGEKVTPDA